LCEAGGRRHKGLDPEASGLEQGSSKTEKAEAPFPPGAETSDTEMEQYVLASELDEYRSDPALEFETNMLAVVQGGLERAIHLTVSEVFALARAEISTEVNGFQVLDSLRGLHDLALLHFDEETGQISAAIDSK
jgi:hypothetical protein